MKDLKNRLKKKYSHLRNKYLPSNEKPNRLIIEKAKWYNNAESPVMLMIDDLANAWHSKNGNDTWDFGGDWGGGLSGDNSVFSFIRANLLEEFPEIKVTFFAVAGSTSQYTHSEPFSFSEPLDYREESKRFFRELAQSREFEIAYHGYNHGTSGEKTVDFVQEWKGFQTVDEACEQISKGKEIFKDVFGIYPYGGKYGGWDYNEFADESIDCCDFLWWCRDWMPRDISGRIGDAYYEPHFFGENMVVALPSTLHGFYWSKKQVDKLLENGQIISIEEHIAPVRPDGLNQAPNIIDDIKELRSLYAYLRDKNVWHATGTEIAGYFMSYSQSVIYDIKKSSFKIKYDGRGENPVLTVIIDALAICTSQKPCIDIFLPDGNKLERKCFKYDKTNYRHIVNIPVINGEYLVTESA